MQVLDFENGLIQNFIDILLTQKGGWGQKQSLAQTPPWAGPHRILWGTCSDKMQVLDFENGLIQNIIDFLLIQKEDETKNGV